ncbi:MAG TPA: high-potential iron-sulfur protein [Burkholderiales bacterium]|nr:high-potential iron-sulfur protein [Burkholderiales bacterium]
MSAPLKPSRDGRRTFLRTCAVVLAAAPLGERVVNAAEMVDPNSEQAKSLHYVTDAKQAKDPKHQAGQFCHNCQFYQGDASAKSAPCALFGGKTVPANAWCNAWVKKAA